MQTFRHVVEILTMHLTPSTRRRPVRTSTAVPTTAQYALGVQHAQLLAMQQAIDGRWQIGVATGIEMARWELSARQASSHLAGIADISGIPLSDVARVVVAEGFPNRD